MTGTRRNKFLTPREEEILKALGRDNQNKNVAAHGLGITQKGLSSHLSRIFLRALDAMDVVAEYAPIFEGRLSKHETRIRSTQRKRARRLREAAR